MFFATLLLIEVFLEMAKNVFFEEIYDGVLCEAAESFEAEINITSKEEEAKTVAKSRFVELSEDDLDIIVNRAEAQTTKIYGLSF